MFVPVSLVPKKTFSWIHLSQEDLRMSSWVKHWELDGSLGKVSRQSIPVWNAQEEEFRIIILSYVISVLFWFFFFFLLDQQPGVSIYIYDLTHNIQEKRFFVMFSVLSSFLLSLSTW